MTYGEIDFFLAHLIIYDLDVLLALFGNEFDYPINGGKNGEVLAQVSSRAGMEFGSSLPDYDVSSFDFLTTKKFYTQALTWTLTVLMGFGTSGFDVCHLFFF